MQQYYVYVEVHGVVTNTVWASDAESAKRVAIDQVLKNMDKHYSIDADVLAVNDA